MTSPDHCRKEASFSFTAGAGLRLVSKLVGKAILVLLVFLLAAAVGTVTTAALTPWAELALGVE